MKRFAIAALVLLAGCTSTASYTLRYPDGAHVDVEAVSMPVGILHQALIVSTRSSDKSIKTEVLPDTSAGQVAVSTLTTGAVVGGAATAAYLGLKQAGQVTVP